MKTSTTILLLMLFYFSTYASEHDSSNAFKQEANNENISLPYDCIENIQIIQCFGSLHGANHFFQHPRIEIVITPKKGHELPDGEVDITPEGKTKCKISILLSNNRTISKYITCPDSLIFNYDKVEIDTYPERSVITFLCEREKATKLTPKELHNLFKTKPETSSPSEEPPPAAK